MTDPRGTYASSVRNLSSINVWNDGSFGCLCPPNNPKRTWSNITNIPPTFFFTTLSKEYEELYKIFDWGLETFNKINKRSLEFSFCDTELKEKLIQQL